MSVIAAAQGGEAAGDDAAGGGAARRESTTVSLRVFAGTAIMSPGTQYKAVVAGPTSTSTEVIQRVLERYGEEGNPKDYELHFVRLDEKTGKVKRQPSFAKMLNYQAGKDFCIILEDDMRPVLVAEWYSSESRRFELHRKVARPASASASPAADKSSNSPSQRPSLLASLRRKKETPRLTALHLDNEIDTNSEGDNSSEHRHSEGGSSQRGSHHTIGSLHTPPPSSSNVYTAAGVAPAGQQPAPTAGPRHSAGAIPASPGAVSNVSNSSSSAAANVSRSRVSVPSSRYESLL